MYHELKCFKKCCHGGRPLVNKLMLMANKHHGSTVFSKKKVMLFLFSW